jgi:hypothetical protein
VCAARSGPHLAALRPANEAGSSAIWRRWQLSGGPGARRSTREGCCKWRGGTHPGGSASCRSGSRMSTLPQWRRQAIRGSSLGQPDPALRCRQAGISVDALRARASRRKLASALPPGRLRGIGLCRATLLGDSAAVESPRVCLSASCRSGTRGASASFSRTRNDQTSAGARHAHLTGVCCALETWPSRRESGRSRGRG